MEEIRFEVVLFGLIASAFEFFEMVRHLLRDSCTKRYALFSLDENFCTTYVNNIPDNFKSQNKQIRTRS